MKNWKIIGVLLGALLVLVTVCISSPATAVELKSSSDFLNVTTTAEATYGLLNGDGTVSNEETYTFETELKVYKGVDAEGNQVTDNPFELYVHSTATQQKGSFNIATGGVQTVFGGLTMHNTPWQMPNVAFDNWTIDYDKKSGEINGTLDTDPSVTSSGQIAWPLITKGLNLPSNIDKGATLSGTLFQNEGKLTFEGSFNGHGKYFRIVVNY